MMWILVDENDSSNHYIICARKEFIIGRKDCNILINNDSSISRKHAVLEVNDSNVTLKDYSKYGTYVNNVKIKSCNLKNEDKILFGTCNSIWSIKCENMVVTTSCLSSSDKKLVKKLLIKLSGKLLSEWKPECLFVVMSQLTITVKVICALISQRFVVTPAYFLKLVESIEKCIEETHPEYFTPPLAEVLVNPEEISFKPNIKRKTLFQNKTFIFLNAKQFKRLNEMILLAGGKTVLLTENSQIELLNQADVCVMSCNSEDETHPQETQDWINDVKVYLKNKGHRSIIDAELGLAILHASVDVFCNPAVNSDSGVDIKSSQSLYQKNTQSFIKNVLSQNDCKHFPLKTENCNSEIDAPIKIENIENNLSCAHLQSELDSKRKEDNYNCTVSTETIHLSPLKTYQKRTGNFKCTEVIIEDVKSEPVLSPPELFDSNSEDNQAFSFANDSIKKTKQVKDKSDNRTQITSGKQRKSDSERKEDNYNYTITTETTTVKPLKINQKRNGKSKCTEDIIEDAKSKPILSDPELFDSNSEDNQAFSFENDNIKKAGERKNKSDDGNLTTVKIVNMKRFNLLPNEFLSTRSLNNHLNYGEMYKNDENFPTNVMETEIVSLIKKSKPIFVKNRASVINFKKFKKVLPNGSNGNNCLPRIIGGRDLMEYSTKGIKNLDFFIESGNKRNSENSSQDLFDYVPRKRKKEM